MQVHLESPVLTLTEAAAYLRLSNEDVASMIDARTLPGVRVGSDYRIPTAGMLACLHGGVVHDQQPSDLHPQLLLPTGKLPFQKDTTFTSYKWPNNFEDHFTEVFSALVGFDGVKIIKIAFFERPSGGQKRKRAIVFVDKYPTVEFTGANDFRKSQLMAGIIKGADRKQVHPGEPVPSEYQGFRLEPYNDHVVGPRCYQNLAVICKKTDLDVMAKHALIRRRLKA